MKKIIKLILVVFIFTSILLYVPFNHVEDEHDHGLFHVVHVHAWGPGDIYGSCTNCPAGTLAVMDAFNPDCTNNGHLFVMCSSCGYGVNINLSALGHDYETKITKEPSCLETGISVSTCSRCGDTNQSTIAALGHNYNTVTTVAPTCTETGLSTTTCLRCQDRYTTVLKALGHIYKEELIEPTCTEDGSRTMTCTRCNDSTTEILKALGHDIKDEKVIKEPTCEEDGIKSGICERCNEEIQSSIKKLGHRYPLEWTLEKEATYFAFGVESKTCAVCGNTITQQLPKKDPTPLYLGGAGTLVAASGALILLRKRGKKIVRNVKEIVEDIDAFKPSFEDKTLVVNSNNEELIKALKDKHYLQVNTCEYDEIQDTVSDNEPDLILCEIDTDEKLNEVIELKKEDWKDYNLSLILDEALVESNKDTLKKLVEDKQIVNYLSSNKSIYNVLVKLVLPVMKPKYNSDETLSNIGGIADLLGIPGISTVLDLYVNGRDIKATLEEGELGVSEKATIISDLAYILGFDTVGDVANLINDVEDIKASLDKEAGANEGKGGIKAGKDIVDVVSDIIDK